MRKEATILFILFFLPFIIKGQIDSSYIIYGTVVNGNTNTTLSGAHLLTTKNIGTRTSNDGEFNLTVFFNDTITISYIGFKTIKYPVPYKENGKYLTKFKLYKDSISLDEVEIFPYPTYQEFREAFLAMDRQKEKIIIKGVNMYIDESNSPAKPSILNPASYIYDRLFDKKAKIRRRLDRRRKTIKKAREEKTEK